MIREISTHPCLRSPSCLLRSLRIMGWMVLLSSASLAATASPQSLLDAGRADDALRLLTPQAIGNNGTALNYVCRTYFALRDWDNAVHYCELAAQSDPNNAEFQLWLGRSYGEKASSAGALNPYAAYGLARKSVAAFATAHTLNPRSVPIARDLAEYYSSAPSVVGGGGDKALAVAAELAPAHPREAARIRAMVAARQGEYEQAEREYLESIRLDNYSAETYLDFARYLKGRKDWERFQKTVETAMQSNHVRPIDRYEAAELLYVAGRDLVEAARFMTAYIQSGNTEEAGPLFRAHYLLGEILQKRNKDFTHAAAEYRAALALASTYRPATEALRRLDQR